jgi:hypothetical protein
MIAYTVICTFQDQAVAEEWIAWLEREHLADVIAAGALDAEAIRFDSSDGQAIRCEVRYHFKSRQAFAAYERDHASALRAKGLEKFPPERGLAYQRSLGEVRAHRRTGFQS